MLPRTTSIWQRDSQPNASGKPGAVQIALTFHLDHAEGRLHTDLERSGLVDTPALTEADVVAFATFFHRVIGNGIAELAVTGCEPVDCEVVIPVNVIPVATAEGVATMLEQFRQNRGGRTQTPTDDA